MNFCVAAYCDAAALIEGDKSARMTNGSLPHQKVKDKLIKQCRPYEALSAMSTQFKVYWQPGCSSCLRAKEFLTSNGIAFDSINVREAAGTMDELAQMGLKTVPVVARGADYVMAQDLDDLAAFVGVELTHVRLAPPVLVQKLDLVLAAAQRYGRQLPLKTLATKLPGRDRTYGDLAYHIFMIAQAFLDAAQDGELTYEHFERRTPKDLASGADIAAFGDSVRHDFGDWWQKAQTALPERVSTYYGKQPMENVLERTAWHAAQHARQLMDVLRLQGIEPDGPLGPRELDGLPLPDHVYDDEVELGD